MIAKKKTVVLDKIELGSFCPYKLIYVNEISKRAEKIGMKRPKFDDINLTLKSKSFRSIRSLSPVVVVEEKNW